ncbi:MAG: hypothetical protein HXY19_09460 [Thermoanaerobaculaceae bacterium]|nr:hypothetical protein [Thermoanaerobaculaceae bacterium]
MKKALIFALALVLAGGVAYANYCARDYVPAATLLVPYAVVGMDSTGLTPKSPGLSTLLWVTNVSSAKQLIHVCVWDAWSEPVVDFDEILSGYDVWGINFSDMLTGHFDYFDTGFSGGFWYTPTGKPVGSGTNLGYLGTPFGPSSNCTTPTLVAPQDTDFGGAPSGCAFPYGYHPEYGSGIVRRLRNAIVTADAQYNLCASGNPFIANPPWLDSLTKNPLFFYVTVDAVNACSLYFADNTSYWDNDVPSENNVLIGDIVYVDYDTNRSDSIPAVHIEADPDFELGLEGRYFYSLRYDTNGTDTREPLATAFAFRYMNAGGVSTELVVWKSEVDALYPDLLYFYYWWAGDPYVYYAWDMNENSKTRGSGPSGFETPEPNVIPFETQKVPLNTTNWTGLMEGDGWMLLVFNPSIPYASQPYFFFIQAWAGVVYNMVNPVTGVTFSTMTEAATMANVWCFPDQTLARTPILGINYNYNF